MLRLSRLALLLAATAACGTAPSTDVPAADATLLDTPFEHPDVPADLAGDPRLYVFVTDALRDEGLPCKLTVRGLDGTPTPAWGAPAGSDQTGEWVDPVNGALAIGRWVLMARGRAVLALPPGRYQLTVTRGMEYAALDLGAVDITAERGAVARGTLRRVVDTAGEIAGEFHVHSEPSFDSDVPLDQRVLSLAAEGVEVFASTDHDALGDFTPAITALGLARFIHWMRGDEVTTANTGHFGAFPLRPDVDPTMPIDHRGLTVAQVIARARAAAPVLQLNHPLWNDHPIGYWSIAGFDPASGRSMMELVSEFDAVEVWNSHTLDLSDAGYTTGGPDAVIDAWMATLQLGHRTTAMGNTDTHRLAHSPPGWPRTYLRVPDDDPARVTDAMVTAAIAAHDASLTSGPFLRAEVADVSGTPVRPGGLARAEAGGRVTVRVELQAATWTPADRVELYANRRMVFAAPVTNAPVDGYVRQRWEVPVALTRDAWVVARTRAAAPLGELAGQHARPLPSLALVNPIYVDADGDGRFTAPGIDGGP